MRSIDLDTSERNFPLISSLTLTEDLGGEIKINWKYFLENFGGYTTESTLGISAYYSSVSKTPYKRSFTRDQYEVTSSNFTLEKELTYNVDLDATYCFLKELKTTIVQEYDKSGGSEADYDRSIYRQSELAYNTNGDLITATSIGYDNIEYLSDGYTHVQDLPDDHYITEGTTATTVYYFNEDKNLVSSTNGEQWTNLNFYNIREYGKKTYEVGTDYYKVNYAMKSTYNYGFSRSFSMQYIDALTITSLANAAFSEPSPFINDPLIEYGLTVSNIGYFSSSIKLFSKIGAYSLSNVTYNNIYGFRLTGTGTKDGYVYTSITYEDLNLNFNLRILNSKNKIEGDIGTNRFDSLLPNLDPDAAWDIKWTKDPSDPGYEGIWDEYGYKCNRTEKDSTVYNFEYIDNPEDEYGGVYTMSTWDNLGWVKFDSSHFETSDYHKFYIFKLVYPKPSPKTDLTTGLLIGVPDPTQGFFEERDVVYSTTKTTTKSVSLKKTSIGFESDIQDMIIPRFQSLTRITIKDAKNSIGDSISGGVLFIKKRQVFNYNIPAYDSSNYGDAIKFIKKTTKSVKEEVSFTTVKESYIAERRKRTERQRQKYSYPAGWTNTSTYTFTTNRYKDNEGLLDESNSTNAYSVSRPNQNVSQSIPTAGTKDTSSETKIEQYIIPYGVVTASSPNNVMFTQNFNFSTDGWAYADINTSSFLADYFQHGSSLIHIGDLEWN